MTRQTDTIIVILQCLFLCKNMAGLKLLGIAVALLLIGLSEGRSILESKRSLKNDQIVREMASLLQVRRHLSDLKESTKQLVTASPSTPTWVDVQEGGSSSHVQLCTDAVSFLSGEQKTFEKRNLIINYVVNYCIRPSSTGDVIALLHALQAAATENEQSSIDWDWSNWQGFNFFTSPSPQPTTLDYWQQLYDELLKYEDNGISTITPPVSEATTEDWFEQFFADLFNDEEVFPSSTTATPRSTTEDFALEEAFNDFWNLIEGEGEEEEEGEEGEEEDDETFNALLNLLEQDEETGNEAEQTLSTDAPNDADEGDEVDNDLPPLETNKRVLMKKRLLDLLAKSLIQKRQEMMKK